MVLRVKRRRHDNYFTITNYNGVSVPNNDLLTHSVPISDSNEFSISYDNKDDTKDYNHHYNYEDNYSKASCTTT
ncbi:hypothetical protein PYJP_20500 [Pyrofollis japonicus]|nr:hypothetical protein PYJP_20500 [Pyrofollis japonicus]